MAASKNRFTPELNEKEVTPELNEKEVIELLENAAPGSLKKVTEYGMKIFQGKDSILTT